MQILMNIVLNSESQYLEIRDKLTLRLTCTDYFVVYENIKTMVVAEISRNITSDQSINLFIL